MSNEVPTLGSANRRARVVQRSTRIFMHARRPMTSHRSAFRFSLVSLLAGSLTFAAACGGNNAASRGDTASASGTVAGSTPSTTSPANAPAMVRGSIQSLTANMLTIRSDSGTVEVQLSQPVQIYSRQPATLARVTPNAFIGVTTVKQPDGTEQATEIHIFPEELRGLGEGSRMMMNGPGSGGGGNHMTNGAVSNSRMTNGTATGSR